MKRTMTVLGMGLLLLTVCVTRAQMQPEPPMALPVLTACQHAQAENVQLKALVLQLQARLAAREAALGAQELAGERTALEQAFRAALHPPEGAVFDWDTFAFRSPPAPPKQEGEKPKGGGGG